VVGAVLGVVVRVVADVVMLVGSGVNGINVVPPDVPPVAALPVCVTPNPDIVEVVGSVVESVVPGGVVTGGSKVLMSKSNV